MGRACSPALLATGKLLCCMRANLAPFACPSPRVWFTSCGLPVLGSEAALSRPAAPPEIDSTSGGKFGSNACTPQMSGVVFSISDLKKFLRLGCLWHCIVLTKTKRLATASTRIKTKCSPASACVLEYAFGPSGESRFRLKEPIDWPTMLLPCSCMPAPGMRYDIRVISDIVTDIVNNIAGDRV